MAEAWLVLDADRQRRRGRRDLRVPLPARAAVRAVGRHHRRSLRPAQGPARHAVAGRGARGRVVAHRAHRRRAGVDGVRARGRARASSPSSTSRRATRSSRRWSVRERVPNAVALDERGRELGPHHRARARGPAHRDRSASSWVFFVNAVSFFAVVGALVAMRPAELHRLHRHTERPRVREGLAYAWSITEIRSTIVLVGVVGTLVYNFPTFLTLLASDTFHGGAGLAGLPHGDPRRRHRHRRARPPRTARRPTSRTRRRGRGAARARRSWSRPALPDAARRSRSRWCRSARWPCSSARPRTRTCRSGRRPSCADA